MRTRTRTILAGLVLAAALVGGVAWATIPDAAGTINGCFRTSLDDQKGQLRIVDDPASCRSNETAIRWNERGVVGATGAAGPKGDDGSNGTEGPQGAKGDTGAAGADGAPGTNGTDGLPGVAGPKGDPCLPDNPACIGPAGATGPAGADGTNGTDGEKGDTGPTGPAGPAGTTTTSTGPGTASTYIREVFALNSVNPEYIVTAWCNPGDLVTGGGVDPLSSGAVLYDKPVNSSSAQGWQARGSLNFGLASGGMKVYAICLNA